jgi:hypothetical protein
MAGKTFPGIGDLEDEAPPLDPADAADSGGSSPSYYSGPTVVDDAKVEQGLKKLRSLDTPLSPPTGIHQAIVDVLDDPARATPEIPIPADLLMPEITVDHARGTAVGRSISGPVVGQQTTQPFDDRALRGTMFGHGVHLPDLEEARRAMLVETSKALAVVERGVPTTNEITVFQPGTYPQRTEIPRGREPQPPLAERFHAEDTPIELHTLVPRKKLFIRVAAAGACIAAIAVAALLWVRANDEADLSARASAASPAARLTKPAEAQQLAAPPSPPPSTAAAQPAPTTLVPPTAPPVPAAKPPSSEEGRTATATPPRDRALAAAAVPAETKSTRPSSPAESAARRPHAASTHSERHHSPASSGAAGGATRPDEGTTPDKPDRPVRGKRPVEEDPDATMAPTIE